jgi:hypothetical protein
VDQDKNRLNKRMLPILMKPYTLIFLTVICVLGELIWFYLSVQYGNKWESMGLFIIGYFLGHVGGGWTTELWDKHYVESRLRRVKLTRTPLGKRSVAFTILALGVPMAMSFALRSYATFLPVLQSYIFGFICGMNIAIYRWARRLPD